MIRILHIISSLETGGGVQQLLLNYYNNIDRMQIKFDFIVHGDRIGSLEQEVNELGSTVYHVTPKKVSFIKNFIEINKVIKEGKYDVVHCHQDFSNFSSLFLAKVNSVPVRISHAHSNFASNKRIRKVRNVLLRHLNGKYANYFFACSKEAGKWLHGSQWKPDNSDSLIMRNAIDINKFEFNNDIRSLYRKKLGVEDKLVLLHVGRFSIEKNHLFLLDILSELLKYHNWYVLLLVGSGPLESEIKQEAIDRCIIENIKFLGARDDVAALMSASDIFLLPSKQEGFGMTAIEAQVSGLRTFVSDSIPLDTKISDLIEYLTIKKKSIWIDKLLKQQGYDRELSSKGVDKFEFSIVFHASEYEKWVKNEILNIRR